MCTLSCVVKEVILPIFSIDSQEVLKGLTKSESRIVFLEKTKDSSSRKNL